MFCAWLLSRIFVIARVDLSIGSTYAQHVNPINEIMLHCEINSQYRVGGRVPTNFVMARSEVLCEVSLMAWLSSLFHDPLSTENYNSLYRRGSLRVVAGVESDSYRERTRGLILHLRCRPFFESALDSFPRRYGVLFLPD